MSREAKEELYHLLELRAARKKECPIAAFKPHPGQMRVLDVCDQTPITLVSSGNRFGKTHFVTTEIISSLIGYRPWMVKDFKLVNNGGNWEFPDRSEIPSDAWVYRPDGLPIRNPCELLFITGLGMTKGVGAILQPKWNELWPQKVKFKPYFGPAGTWIKIRYKGSTITFATDTQAPSTFEGSATDRVFIDEPIRKQILTATRRGLVDNGGNILWAMTPVGTAKVTWIVNDFILNKERTDFQLITGKGSENPYINQDALQAFLNDPTLSQDERDARSEGKIYVIGKKIISTYDESKVLIPPTDIPPDVERMMVVDPHHSKPACIVWFALLGQEHWVIYREYPSVSINTQKVPNTGIKDLVAVIKSAEGKENVKFRVCDPSFGRQHGNVLGQRYKSFQEEMAEYGLLFDAYVDNNLERGIRELRDAFRPNEIVGRPKIQVFNSLVNVKTSLNLWAYTETPTGELKPSETFKDFADCIRYGVMYNPVIGMTDNDKCCSYLEDEEDE